jgi:hypothetical protein
MKTTVDIDERVLQAAEECARKQGKELGKLIEEILRMTTKSTVGETSRQAESSVDEGLEGDDPFFAALEEIRSVGLLPAPHRHVQFS